LRATAGGVSGAISVTDSSRSIRRMAILVALSDICTYAPCAPRVRTVKTSHMGDFSPYRTVHGLEGSPFRQQSPRTSSR